MDSSTRGKLWESFQKSRIRAGLNTKEWIKLNLIKLVGIESNRFGGEDAHDNDDTPCDNHDLSVVFSTPVAKQGQRINECPPSKWHHRKKMRDPQLHKRLLDW